jgi:hypothetical protein
MKTILAMGQSNTVGMGTGGAWNIPSTVTVWNCAGNSSDASTGLGTAFSTPANKSAAPFIGNNNMMAHACRYLAHELGEDIRLIIVACSGFAISNWCNSAGVTGSMYARMVAVLAAAGVTSVDAFLWHQGEADATISSSYTASWNALLSHMTTDGYIASDTPIVMGELGIWQTVMNPVIRAISDASSRIGLADISCFPVNTTDLHFNGPSLVRAGCEYARELMKLPGAFYITPPADVLSYVAAPGSADHTIASGQATWVLVKAENGMKSLIQNGAFVADRLGVWEFSGLVCSFTYHVSLCLIDETGAVIQYLAGTGVQTSSGVNPYIDGSSTLALGFGDKVFLGVLQVTGSTISVAAVNSAWLNRMTVRFLGRM